MKAKKLCTCGHIENMEHVYMCTNLNKENPKNSYESIFKDDVCKQLEVCKRFRNHIDIYGLSVMNDLPFFQSL